jgi:hypothetical protein
VTTQSVLPTTGQYPEARSTFTGSEQTTPHNFLRRNMATMRSARESMKHFPNPSCPLDAVAA